MGDNVYTNHQKTVCFAVYVEESQNILILTLRWCVWHG